MRQVLLHPKLLFGRAISRRLRGGLRFSDSPKTLAPIRTSSRGGTGCLGGGEKSMDADQGELTSDGKSARSDAPWLSTPYVRWPFSKSQQHLTGSSGRSQARWKSVAWMRSRWCHHVGEALGKKYVEEGRLVADGKPDGMLKMGGGRLEDHRSIKTSAIWTG